MNEESIFLTALEKSSVGERSAYLDEACAGDLDLRARVEALITEHENPGSFLDGPPLVRNRTDLSQSTLLERDGTVVGRYKLLEQIGEGGFGVVFMAEQLEPVRRNVAVKIIKPGMDSKPVIARFESERQALAMMDHQNIAKVLDAGTTDLGRPYFVMELVKGSPITQFCDDHKLTPDQRLELFIPVCHAIQHAHQKGIIHRDIKPSNVLVCHFDGEPVPKVIDFGVAKAIDQRLTNQTVFTKFGQIIGTLEYMSPEQAEMSQLDIDTRSDIYSLGTLLYELLTGTTPFEADRLRSAAFDEMRRIIREEVPQLPSQRLTTIENLRTVTAKRRVDAQSLRRIVRGELDWIVMKSLEKQRTRRYESATNLARDLRRYLKREPVEAGPPSRAYQLRKFVSRNRAAVVTACTLLAVLCLGVIGTSMGMARARNEAVKASVFAERNMKLAESEQAAKRETEDQLRIVKAWGLTAYSQATRNRFPVRSLLLARESVAVTWGHDKTVTPIAHESLLSAVSDFGGRPLVGHKGGSGSLQGVWTLDISADGRWLVSGSLDGTVRLWDLKADDISGSSVELSGHAGVLTAAFITADSRWIVAGSWNMPIRQRGSVYLWDLHAEQPSKMPVHLPNDAGVSAAAASVNGRWLVTGSVDGAVRHWDLHAVAPSSSAVLLHDHEQLTMAVAIDSTGQRIAAQNGVNLRLWNLTSDGIRRESYSLTAQKFAAGVLKISPDDRWLISGGTDGSIVRWNMSSTPPSGSRARLEGHTGAITSMSISTDSKWLATASFDKTARLWNLTDPDPSVTSRLLWGHRDLVQTIAISPDDRWLATGDRDAVVRVWDLKSENPVEDFVELRGHERRAWAVKFTPDSRWLVTAGMDPTVRMWAIGKDGPRVSSWIKHCAPVEITVSPNGRWLATGADSALYLWKVRGEGVRFEPFAELRGHATNTSPRGDFTTSIAFSHNAAGWLPWKHKSRWLDCGI